MTLLKRSCFNVFSATSGTEALRIHCEEPIDLIISDLVLDDMGGDEFCCLVRGDLKRGMVPFVLVCHDSPEGIARAESNGASAWIKRPVQPLQLLKTVGQFLSVQLVRSRRVSLRVSVFSRSKDLVFYCMSHNVSISGILLETEERLDVGEQIVCRFTILDDVKVEVDGEVVRTERTIDGGYCYGVQFFGMKRHVRKEIDRYIVSVSRNLNNSLSS